MKKIISLLLAVVLCVALAVPAFASYGPITLQMWGSIFCMYEAEDQGKRHVAKSPFDIESVNLYGIKTGTKIGGGGQDGYAMLPTFIRVDFAYEGSSLVFSNPESFSPLTEEKSECTIDELYAACGVAKGMALLLRTAEGMNMLCLDGASLPERPAKVAYEQKQTIMVDELTAELTTYALKDAYGGMTNYVRLRDIAKLMSWGKAPFNVTWDGAVNILTNTPYVSDGSEFSVPFFGDQDYKIPTSPTKVDGTEVTLSAILLTDAKGGGYTYYKLRDLGQALNFDVSWSAEKGIYVNSDKPYTPD